ncbi:MAG: c-type cytochrome [Gemmatimonadota bacterium]|nr:c-type cytochrome [Gemmatimonadota bacterium]
MKRAPRVLRSRLSSVVAGLAGAWLAAVPSLPAQSAPLFAGDPIAGRRTFIEGRCVRCHAIWGNGGTLGPDFAMVGAGRSLAQLAGMFWNHTPQMIETVRGRGFEWPTFTESELANIISYIYYVKLFDAPGDPALGQRWFVDKGCAECHSVGGTGGRIGLPLDGYARYIAPIALAQGLWNHGPGMQERQSIQQGRALTFSGREIADLQAFIRARSTLRNRTLILLQPPDPGRGGRLFATKQCVRCHGPNGRGTSWGPDLRAATQQLRVSEIAGRLWNHSASMAVAMRARGIVFPQFQGSEMADVIAFLYYLRFYDTGGDVRNGERVFEAKGCAACHRIDEPPQVGPDLSQSEAPLTPLGLATAMWDHAPAMYTQIRSADVEWPRFEGEEMRDLSVYLRSLVLQRRAAAGRR